MPLFRFHRGSLQDSLNTTVLVKNMEELHQACQPFISQMFWMKDPCDFTLEISPYPSKFNNFDNRIGWYTHIVCLTINCPSNENINNINSAPIGFLSEAI